MEGIDGYDFAGTKADRLASAQDYERWAALLERQRAEHAEVIEPCLEDADDCPRYLRGYRVLIERGAEEPPERQLYLINRFMNQRRWWEKPPGEDFQTITAFFRRGGSCEDVALAKYFALRELGFDTESLRVVIVYDREYRAYHAVTAVELEDDGIRMMDVDDRIFSGGRRGAYRYLFALNEDAVWDHGGLR